MRAHMRSIQTGISPRCGRVGVMRPDGVSGWYARLDRVESDRVVQMKTWLGAWSNSLEQGVPVAAILPKEWPTLPAALLADAGHVVDQLLARHDAEQDGRSPRGAHAIPIKVVDAIIADEMKKPALNTQTEPSQKVMALDALPPGFRDRLNELHIEVEDGKKADELIEDDVLMKEVEEGKRTISGIVLPFADPSCGAGVFAARLMKKHADYWNIINDHGKMEEDSRRLFSSLQLLDIDNVAVEICRDRMILEARKLSLIGDGPGKLSPEEMESLVSKVVKRGDALQEEWPWNDSPRICCINPPWLRIKDRFRGHPEGSTLRKNLGKALRDCKNLDGKPRFSTMRGNVNLYRLFIERGLQIITNGGHLRAVAPDSLLREQSSAPLRRLMVEENQWKKLWCIEEGNQIYPGIAQGVLIISLHKGGKTNEILSIGPVERNDLLSEEGGIHSRVPRITITRERWLGWTMGTWAIPRLPKDPYERNKVLRVIDELAKRPRLSDPANELAADGVAARIRVGEIDQTSFSHVIKSWKKSKKAIPFVRGAHFSSDDEGKVSIRHPGFGDKQGEKEQSMWAGDRPVNSRPRLACQAIVNSQQKRRLRWAVMPEGCVLGNSVNHLQLPDAVEKRLTKKHGDLAHGLEWVCERLNDPRLDAWAKAWAANNNVNNYELETLPLSLIDGYAVSA